MTRFGGKLRLGDLCQLRRGRSVNEHVNLLADVGRRVAGVQFVNHLEHCVSTRSVLSPVSHRLATTYGSTRTNFSG